MNEKRLCGLMGLCVRARQATFGMDGCLQAIRTEKAGVVLLDGEASEGTRQKYEAACEHHGIPLVILPQGLLQEATGRSGVAMAVAPGGLADQIRSLSGL
ncbi:MAG: ribosomal L7Ae/L30e/S12e/Gadd45 family protein [Clostridia bacterium]|nr:ribosomal L7Ae/L30e/S12e/Gadd45 family protein [Clostridia bacterium]